jgi:hypothetical protein
MTRAADPLAARAREGGTPMRNESRNGDTTMLYLDSIPSPRF